MRIPNLSLYLRMVEFEFETEYKFEFETENKIFHEYQPSCNLKTIAFTVFCFNMLFTYFWVSYNIVKFQTCSSWHS